MDFVRYFYPHIYDEIMTGLIFFSSSRTQENGSIFSCFFRFSAKVTDFTVLPKSFFKSSGSVDNFLAILQNPH